MIVVKGKEKERVKRPTTSLNISSGSGAVKAVTNCVAGSVKVPKDVTKSGGNPAKKKERHWKLCLACNVDGATNLSVISHPMESCSIWNSLSREKRSPK